MKKTRKPRLIYVHEGALRQRCNWLRCEPVTWATLTTLERQPGRTSAGLVLFSERTWQAELDELRVRWAEEDAAAVALMAVLDGPRRVG